MAKVVGIDLGTTNSCVAVTEGGKPLVIPNPSGSRTTPSVVAFTDDGERHVGLAAKRYAATAPQNTVFGVKRLMGQRFQAPDVQRHLRDVPYRIAAAANGDAWVQVGEVLYPPPQISAMVLASMRESAESFLGEAVREAVITVPAYFDDAQRQATVDAGQIAGLKVKRIINEPTAAALAYGLQGPVDQKRTVVVYDLGGGTFDVSILDIADGVFHVRATAGDTHLGGEDLDAAMVERLMALFSAQTGVDLRQHAAVRQRLRDEAQRAKHELSTVLETEVNVPFLYADGRGPHHLAYAYKRSELEMQTLALIEQTLRPCEQAMRDAGTTPAQIDEVILVGGQTRMPLVQAKVAELFRRPASRSVDPDEVVAIGAALQAAALDGQIDDLLLLDVIPLGLGVETGGGVFHRLIPRNTKLPVCRSEVFTTSLDNQPFVPVHVLQGERDMAADNRSLSRFELGPLPPAPREVPQIEVSFDVNVDGILQVRAKDLGTGREQALQIKAASGLSAAEVEQCVAEAQQHRVDDTLRKEIASLKNQAASLLYTSEQTLTECANLLPPEVLDAMQQATDQLRQLVATSDELQALREALQQLELTAYQAAEVIYGGG